MFVFGISGYKVSDTIRKGIVDVSVYENDQDLYMQGNLAALGESWFSVFHFRRHEVCCACDSAHFDRRFPFVFRWKLRLLL